MKSLARWPDCRSINELGNLEGKELRFGTSAGATFAAVTTAVTCGSVNCMHDSLNPLAGLTPFTGMWLNCVFGGKGVGLINMLVYLIVGVFLAGLMVGRTPEYLGKKVEAREMKLAMLALLVHPHPDPGPDRPVRRLRLGHEGDQQSRRPRLLGNPVRVQLVVRQQRLRLRGPGRHLGLQQDRTSNSTPAPFSRDWDIATGLVMLLGRFIPIIAPLALAAELGGEEADAVHRRHAAHRHVHVRLRAARHDPAGGALLFLPAAVLGPVAEHLGPMPLGG